MDGKSMLGWDIQRLMPNIARNGLATVLLLALPSNVLLHLKQVRGNSSAKFLVLFIVLQYVEL
ncbi:uncharacterized protein CLUP02_11033 [Colletotrichum lupini]|uniref:Uncharacterized protein n=1 Tax=Colletotrichum lupini TaxID=145971 RepID=A0A9Q8WK41_9PEZI|nr:uncharacterized protein CLUP02_11033 [Colletotrichum lupini]UQC85535.1 hypothetical protein CLUP02_11033 [Colletotrichum lupini]